MDSLQLIDYANWNGDVALYGLPSTKTSFRSDLATLLVPQCSAKQALLFVQQTHLGGQSHDHLHDQLVLIRSIDVAGRSIVGILTDCWRCIDLWMPVHRGIQLVNIQDLLEKSETEGTLSWLEMAKGQSETGKLWFKRAHAITRPAHWSMARHFDSSVAPLRLRDNTGPHEEEP